MPDEAEMPKIQGEIDAENVRRVELQAHIHGEAERLNAEAWQLGLHQDASDAVHERRHESRRPLNLELDRLFNTPQCTQGTEQPQVEQPHESGQQPQTAQPPPAEASACCFHTPVGHFSNPVDNMLAAT